VIAPQVSPALQRWFVLPSARTTCLLHFMALAVTLSAAKVILNTAAAALFLAKEGPGQLPLFYVLLALVAILLSLAFAGVIDRVPRIRLGQAAFFGILLGVGLLRDPIALGVPGVYYALLASAHIYEIVIEVVFWLIVATFLDAIELKRGTPFIYMALAAGGLLGGAFMNGLVPFVPTADLLLALPVLGTIAVAQFEIGTRRLQELRDPDHGEPATTGAIENLLLLPRLVARYPLIGLIALNAAMLTILYGLSEYLVFTVYADRFPDERALTRFLATIYAVVQVLEFAVLFVITRPLFERAGPLARNLVFPLTSLACLSALAVGHRLPVAIATHMNAEAASNAIFQPINNANYVALPLRFQGRMRTVADGIFYPSGLALAGLMLLFVQDQLATLQVTFIAITFALLFVVQNVGVGVIFLPTLLRNLRSGIVDFADLPPSVEASVSPAKQIAELLQSDDPDVRSIALDLADRVDPAPIVAELPRLAPRADRAMRRVLARALVRARSAEIGRLLDDLLDGTDEPARLTALQAKLARGEAIDRSRAERLARSPSRSVAVLARLAAGRPGNAAAAALPGLAEWSRDPEVAADLIDALAGAARADLVDPLIAVVEVAPLEQQRRGLRALGEKIGAPNERAGELARRLASHPDPVLRAEAIALLRVLATSPAELGALGRALGDPSRLVRKRAVAALAAHGDAAIDIARVRLSASRPEVVETAIEVLGRIGSRRAREVLAASLQPIYQQARRNLDWLQRLPPSPERRAWAALELALIDHNQRLVDFVMNVLAELGEKRSLALLRRALAASDRRTRANALEALLSLPYRRLVRPVLPLLETAVAAHEPATTATTAVSSAAAAEILTAAASAADPWVRAGAACAARALRAVDAEITERAKGQCVHAKPGPRHANDPVATPTELDMERVLFLKRLPLFRYLPLDTLLAVSRVLERQEYLAGEPIVEAGARSDHFCIVASGAVDVVGAHGGAERLVAPACFGELVLADERPASSRVVAVENCVLLRLHRIVFHDLSREHPEILVELCRLLARRLRRIQDQASPGA
jgi:HEAT repeat protein